MQLPIWRFSRNFNVPQVELQSKLRNTEVWEEGAM
jgi:hypothetical protein